MLVNRVHGGADAAGVAAHDFSTNANACGPCPMAWAAVQAADAAHYPDPAYTALRERLAAFHAVSVGRIVFAASASEFIFRITAAVACRGGRAVSVPRPAYGDYAAAAEAWGLSVIAAGAVSGVASGIRGGEAVADLAWACEPASPVRLPGASGLAEAWMSGAAVRVLDRAYEPLRLTGACPLDAAQLDAVWQLYSPNKALGLTGVRAAYAVAPAAEAQGGLLMRHMEALSPSWPVGAHGVALLTAWCEPALQQWLAESREWLRAWKARQASLCNALGWTVLPGDANFLCCRVPGAADRLSARLQALRGRGVKLRDCASLGLAGHVRLGVRPPASQDALRTAWLAVEEPQEETTA